MRSYMIIIISSTLLSCSKVGKNAGVEGRIVNPLTDEGIPNVKVEFVVKEQLSLPGGFKKIKETTTDENGYFEIHALRVLKAVYVQAQTDQNYYKIGWYQDGEMISDGFRVRVDKGRTMHADFHAVPYGQTIFDIKNVNCTGPTDSMWFRHRSQFDEEFPELWSTPRVGCYNYISPDPFGTFEMGTRYFQVRVKRNGQTTVIESEVFIEENGITTIYLHY